MINLGSRLVPSLPADHDVEGVAKPLQILARKRLVIGVQVLIQERPEFPPVLFPIRQCMRDRGPQIRTKPLQRDRKSTRLNSSHQIISYAVFCLKKKTNT